jgi:pimeloyl-ACP methyl ester carboxylesterase
MKKMGLFLLWALTLSILLPQAVRAQPAAAIQATSPAGHIETLGDVVRVERLPPGPYAEKFKVVFRQSLDATRPEAGTFEQRFFVLHRGADRPVVYVTEGYGGGYAENPQFTHEIAERYDANLIVVEHRYFGPSTPAPRDWDYLTVRNSMNDLHRIREAMSSIYPGKWIATGISKGGQTTIMYAVYFPGDADGYVPYVAPVCFGVEDGRHERFIEHLCGTPEDRAKILAFQREALERRDEIRPLFEALCNEQGLKFRIPIEEVYDYCVLEYSFAFWQWGVSVDRIPVAGSSARLLFDHLTQVAGPDYFAISDEPSFFVQAARQLGYYGYDTRPFKGLLVIRSAKGYLHRILLPDDARRYRFSHRVHRDVYRYLRKNDPKMICVNGEFDPWNAVSLDRSLFEGKANMLRMVDAGGSHRARISTLDAEQQAEVWHRIEGWISE